MSDIFGPKYGQFAMIMNNWSYNFKIEMFNLKYINN